MKRIALLAVLSSSATALADWPSDASVDVPVANLDTSTTPNLVNDGDGGVFVIFNHTDATPSNTIRGEHFTGAGDRLWSTTINAATLARSSQACKPKFGST